MRVYVASSWRNPFQPSVVEAIRKAGHEAYDFRNPREGEHGFAWSDIDPEWQQWTATQFRAALDHPIAMAGFKSDHEAMDWAEACVLVLPCGRSAHLEAGEFIGSKRPLFIYQPRNEEPELMYRGATALVVSITELLEAMG